MTNNRFAFTVDRLRRIKRPERLERYYDTKTPGLMFVITPNDARTFYFAFSSPELFVESTKGLRKKTRQLTLGRFPSLTVDQARKACSDAAALLASDIDPMEWRRRKRDEIQLEAAVNEDSALWTLRYQVDNDDSAYWRNAKRRQLKTTDNAVRVMRKHFTWMIDHRLDDITGADLQVWYDGAISEKRASDRDAKIGGINRAVSYLQGVYRQLREATAFSDNPFTANPFIGFHTVSEPKEKITFIEPEQQSVMLDAVDELVEGRPDWAWFGLLVRFALATGCRRGEILSAKIDQFEKRGDRVLFHVPENKANRPHDVPINPKLWKLIQEYRVQYGVKSDGYLFPRARGATFKDRDIRDQWKALHEKALLPADFTFHSLRHQFAVNALKAGVRIETLRELMNHANISTTQRYAHVLPETKVDAIDKIGEGVF